MGRKSTDVEKVAIAAFLKKMKTPVMVGAGSLGTGYAASKLYDKSENPEQRFSRIARKKQNEMLKAGNADIEKVRQDIKDYEKHKKNKHLSTAAAIASLAGSGIGGYTGNKKILIPSMAAAFASGFARGRSKREERAALGRVKKFYDLRSRTKDQEKVAVIGGVAELLSAIPQVFGADMGTLAHGVSSAFNAISVSPEVAVLAGAAAPTAIDIATLPWAAHKATASTREHAHIAAKDAMGIPLDAKEKAKRAWSTFAKSEQMKIEQMKPGFRKKFNEYFKGIYGPLGTGGDVGEALGAGLKELDKISPRYSNLALNAIKDQKGFDTLKSTVKSDLGTLSEAGNILNSTIDEIPGLRRLINSTGKSSSGIIKKILENPEEAINAANQIKSTVIKSVRGSKYMAGAAGLAALGLAAGSYRQRHPLATDTLPKNLTDKMKEDPKILPFNR